MTNTIDKLGYCTVESTYIQETQPMAHTNQRKIDIVIGLLKEKYELQVTPIQECELQQDLEWALTGNSLLASRARGE